MRGMAFTDSKALVMSEKSEGDMLVDDVPLSPLPMGIAEEGTDIFGFAIRDSKPSRG